MRHTTAVILVLFFSILTACGSPAVDTRTGDGAGLALTAAQDAAITYFVNHPQTTLEVLDVTVGLDRRAAEGLIAARPFSTVAEIDAVAWVGPVALERLASYTLGGTPWTESVEDVSFTTLEAAVVVWGVNGATMHELDELVPLNARSAENLLAGAPYDSVSEMGEVAWIGPAALGSLKAYATTWRMQLDGEGPPLAGTFDGVAFDEATAIVALDIANYATTDELIEWGGMWQTGAARIVDARPYATLYDVAGVSGVGETTMQSLRDLAASGMWPTGPCGWSVAPADVSAVAAYHDGIAAFDPGEPYSHYQLSAWEVPSCLDLQDAATRAAATQHAIDTAGWNWVADEFPEMLIVGDVSAGTSQFDFRLTRSLQRLQDLRDDYLADGETWAQAAYEELEDEHAAVSDLAHAHPASTWDFTVTVDAIECSEYQAVLFDLSAGLLIEIHRGPAC